MTAVSARPANADVTVGPLAESDVAAADAVFRLAFGTALGLPEPERFAAGAEMVRTRWLADPSCAFKAESRGRLVACAFVTRWRSHALLGPLAVHPDLWNRGVGRLLWEACLPLLDRWGVTHTALFTRVEPKNIHLYQELGFWPGFLTALTAKPLDALAPSGVPWRTLADLPAVSRASAIEECRRLTDSIDPGLDLEREIRALADQGIGDTILVEDDGVCGFAVCHAGTGSEAGPDNVYVKFAAVAPCRDAKRRFERLLDACEEYAAARGLVRLAAGVNVGRREAYRTLLDRGHRTFLLGVAMHRPDEPTYDRPGVYILDDRR